ncbi:MAG: hypothetical protein HY936_06630 [Nitrosomonadales bacterium]|nr:hypothetical protein [Nitrosomonadales bacterium]
MSAGLAQQRRAEHETQTTHETTRARTKADSSHEGRATRKATRPPARTPKPSRKLPTAALGRPRVNDAGAEVTTAKNRNERDTP